MLVSATLLVMSFLVILSLILGNDFIGSFTSMSINNEAIVDGASNTFVVASETIFYNIDTNTLQGAIIIVIGTLVGMALLTGISVVSTGLNPQSARIVVLASIYGVVWLLMSLIVFGMITLIPTFGALIYVFLTIGYVVGVIKNIAGGNG